MKRVSRKHPSHNTALMELSLLSRAMREAVHRGFILANPLERMGIRKDRRRDGADGAGALVLKTDTQ